MDSTSRQGPLEFFPVGMPGSPKGYLAVHQVDEKSVKVRWTEAGDSSAPNFVLAVTLRCVTAGAAAFEVVSVETQQRGRKL